MSLGRCLSKETVEVEGLEELLGVLVKFLRLLGFEGRDLGNVLVLTLTLLLLELEGDTADGSTLDTLHQVGGETGNLVSESLGGDDSDLIGNTLVGLEVESETGVVLLDESTRSSLDGLGSNSTLYTAQSIRCVCIVRCVPAAMFVP